MYGKIKIAGHPVHPMLVAFPVACYAGTLVGFAVYAAKRLFLLVHLIPEQELAEPAVQHHHLSLLHQHAA